MTNTEHTPGPWQAEDVTSKGTLVYRRIQAGPKSVGFAGAYKMKTRAEELANANLIAAAPELLADLKVARNMVVSWSIDSLGPEAAVKNVAGIDATIAKATGQAVQS